MSPFSYFLSSFLLLVFGSEHNALLSLSVVCIWTIRLSNSSSPCIGYTTRFDVREQQWPLLLFSFAQVQLNERVRMPSRVLQRKRTARAFVVISIRECTCYTPNGLDCTPLDVCVRLRHFARAVCRQLSQLRQIDKQINRVPRKRREDGILANHSNGIIWRSLLISFDTDDDDDGVTEPGGERERALYSMIHAWCGRKFMTY